MLKNLIFLATITSWCKLNKQKNIRFVTRCSHTIDPRASNPQKIKALFIKLAVILCFIPSWLMATELVAGNAKDVGLSFEKLGRIDEVMQSYVDDHRLANIEVLVARKGKIVYNQSFSKEKPANGKPSLYRIASMTKPITSVAIMILMEQGKLKLTDPVSRYIPELKNMKVLIDDDKANESTQNGGKQGDANRPSSAKAAYHLVDAIREITIKDLLTHTSGIIYGFKNEKHLTQLHAELGISDGLSDNTGTIGDNVKKMALLPLKHQPGKHFTYGLSTDVLGYLVEVISGSTLDQFIKQKILVPLKMNDTQFYLSEKMFSRLVPLYTPNESGGIRKIDEKKDKNNLVTRYQYTGVETYYSGGGGLVSSAMDYARFLQMMLNKGELDGERILLSNTVSLMFSNHIRQIEQGDKNFKFGLGFMIHNKPITPDVIPEGSLSWGGIFHTSFWIDPKNDIIGVSMAQKFPAPKSDVHDKFEQLVYAALED